MFLSRHLVLAVGLTTIVLAPATASPMPVLWGVDEDDGQLFSLGDYRDPLGTFTDYGRLMYRANGRLRRIGNNIEAFTIAQNGIAYLALNDDLRGIDEPVLMSLDLAAVNPDGPNVVDIIGRFAVEFDSGADNITGLAVHPRTGQLYALFRDEGRQRGDRLLIIDPQTGGVLSDLGVISGLGTEVRSGEDMVFDSDGYLYVADNYNDQLYRIDPRNASIVDVVNRDLSRGLNGSVKFEALAWDYDHGVLLGFDDHRNRLAMLSIDDEPSQLISSLSTLGLTDVEGASFVTIPEPASAALLGAAIVGLFVLRRR